MLSVKALKIKGVISNFLNLESKIAASLWGLRMNQNDADSFVTKCCHHLATEVVLRNYTHEQCIEATVPKLHCGKHLSYCHATKNLALLFSQLLHPCEFLKKILAIFFLYTKKNDAKTPYRYNKSHILLMHCSKIISVLLFGYSKFWLPGVSIKLWNFDA